MTVALLGDRLKDVYWAGRASKLSPEAPIPIVKVEFVVHLDGGAANVERNLRDSGLQVVTAYPKTSTVPEKHRLMVGEVQIARWDVSDEIFVDEEEMKRVGEDLLERVVPQVDGVVISDYGKGTIPIWMCRMFGDLSCPTFIDTKRNPMEYRPSKEKTDLFFFPNSGEWEKWKDCYKTLPSVVVKRGAAGAEFRRFGIPMCRAFFTGDVKVKCVVGAGDTALAWFVWGWLLSTGDVKEALRCAVAGGTAAVEEMYTSSPSKRKVMEKYRDVTVCEEV